MTRGEVPPLAEYRWSATPRAAEKPSLLRRLLQVLDLLLELLVLLLELRHLGRQVRPRRAAGQAEPAAPDQPTAAEPEQRLRRPAQPDPLPRRRTRLPL